MKKLCGLLLVVGCQALAAPALSQTETPNLEFDCVIVPRQIVDLGSATNGILKEVMVEPGDAVKKGDPVARLEDDVQKATVDLARLRANNDIAIASSQQRATYFDSLSERAKDLFDKKVSTLERMEKAEIEAQLSEHELRTAKLEKEMAVVELRRVEALLKQKTIAAPMDGVIMEKHLGPGAFVYEQAAVVTMAAIDPLIVEVFVPVANYRRITQGQMARVMPNEPIGGVKEAKVLTVDPVFDAASGTFRVRLELPNADHEIPGGLRCRVDFATVAE